MPAAAPPSPEQFLPDLKRVSFSKNGFKFIKYGHYMARDQWWQNVPEFGAHPALPEQRAAARLPAVTRENLGAGGSEVLCTRPAAIGLHLGHTMDRVRRRGSTGCVPPAIFGTISPLSSIAIFKHIEIFQNIFQK
jgi:hypothetical protein